MVNYLIKEQNALHVDNETKNDNGERIVIRRNGWALRSSFVRFASLGVNFLEIKFYFLIKLKHCAKTKELSKREITTNSEKYGNTRKLVLGCYYKLKNTSNGRFPESS